MKNVCETINANDAGETFNIFKSSQTFNESVECNRFQKAHKIWMRFSVAIFSLRKAREL